MKPSPHVLYSFHWVSAIADSHGRKFPPYRPALSPRRNVRAAMHAQPARQG
ncbi:hypothetical protein SXCC_01589 [Gluconacetobacter sp. SXCC-1]|nr:hypothetical protein SXCC_01589 [Gluconacetobacter sp. SXCC-1]